jgi:hypothetical protein
MATRRPRGAGPSGYMTESEEKDERRYVVSQDSVIISGGWCRV